MGKGICRFLDAKVCWSSLMISVEIPEHESKHTRAIMTIGTEDSLRFRFETERKTNRNGFRFIRQG